MVTTYYPLTTKNVKMDDQRRLCVYVELLEGLTGLVKKTQLPSELTASGNLRVATVEDTVWQVYKGTFWSGAVVNPGDNEAVGVYPYTRNTLYIRSHSGEMTFRVWLHDGYEYMEMETKTFSGDMIWTVDHLARQINLQSLSSGMVTARLMAARW
jgi:hypothetical protein